MQNDHIHIIGAGLTGLIAAHAWPRAKVRERMSKPTAMHKAVLRFRDTSVSSLVGIPFEKVLVRKACWGYQSEVQPTIALANQYSRKVIGRVLGNRSIWNLEPAERYVAPPDFYERLVEQVGSRISWGEEIRHISPEPRFPVISTIPLGRLLDIIGIEHPVKFDHSPIMVVRFQIPDCNAHQTIYFPDSRTPLYRASITGDIMIAEISLRPGLGQCVNGEWIGQGLVQLLRRAFGLTELIPIEESHTQQFGKIDPIDDRKRRAILYQITQSHGIYFLGRFATWRNILLDDIPNDCARIKQLMRGDDYSNRLAAAG